MSEPGLIGWWRRPQARVAGLRLGLVLPLGAWLLIAADWRGAVAEPLPLVLLAYLVYSIAEMIAAARPDARSRPADSRIGLYADLLGLTAAVLTAGATAAPLLPLYLVVVLGYGVMGSWRDLLMALCGALAGMTSYALLGYLDAGSEPIWLTAALLTTIFPVYLKLSFARLESAKAQGEQQHEVASRLVADLHHELRTPLQGVIGACEVLRMETKDVEQRRLADAIEQTAWLELALIDNELIRMEMEFGSAQASSRDFDLHKLINVVTRLTELKSGLSGLRLAVKVSPEVPARLHGNDACLTRLLLTMVEAFFRAGVGVGLGFHVSIAGRTGNMLKLRFDLEALEPLTHEELIGEKLRQPETTKLLHALECRVESFLAEEDSADMVRLEVPLSGAVEAAVPGAAHSPSRLLVVGETLMARQLEAMAASWRATVDHETSSARAFARLSRAPQDGVRYGAVLVQRHHVAMTPAAFLKSLHGESSLQDLPVVLIDHTIDPEERRRLMAIGYAAVLSEPLEPASLYGALQGVRRLGEEPILPIEQHAVPRTDPLRILIAEDNQTNALLISKMLEHAGHQVRVVNDGQAALDALQRREQAVDLAIMDFNMPKLDGLEVLRRYHKDCSGGPAVPCLLLTASDVSKLRSECEGDGIAAVLSKPVDYRSLMTSIGLAIRDARSTECLHLASKAAIDRLPVLDEARLDSLSENDLVDRVSLRELSDVFRRDGAQKVANIERAIQMGDTTAIESGVASLHALASELGAPRLAAQCSMIERMAGSAGARPAIASQVRDVVDAFVEASSAIEDYLDRSSKLARER